MPGRVAGFSRAAAVDSGRVHEAGGGQSQRLAAAARPPGERQRRVKQRERRLEQRQRRVAAGHHDGGPRRADRPHRDLAPAPGPAADHQAARGAEAEPGGQVGVQRQRDERVAHGGQRDPGTRAADRGERPGQHRIAEVTGAEQLLDRHAERPGQAEGDP